MNIMKVDTNFNLHVPATLLRPVSNQYTRESMNLLIPSAMGQNIPLLFFYKDGFDIKRTHEVWYAIN